MRFDVVSIRSTYRGIGRSLTPLDFQSQGDGSKLAELIELYLSYIEEHLKPESQETFEYMLRFCRVLKEHEIPCEVIVYDCRPIEEAYGKTVNFLGIDLVHKMSESLLEDGCWKLPARMLNENMLLTSELDANKVIPLCDNGGCEWLPCWVYSVVC